MNKTTLRTIAFFVVVLVILPGVGKLRNRYYEPQLAYEVPETQIKTWLLPPNAHSLKECEAEFCGYQRAHIHKRGSTYEVYGWADVKNKVGGKLRLPWYSKMTFSDRGERQMECLALNGRWIDLHISTPVPSIPVPVEH